MNREIEIMDEFIRVLKDDIEYDMSRLVDAMELRERMCKNEQILTNLDDRYPMTSALVSEFSHINNYVAEITGDN